MSSQPRIEIQGQAPFKQSGIYETQISIIDVKPSDDEIRTKKFTPLWKGNFHLKVKDGVFSEKLGDTKNPLPSSIDKLDSIWIVVNDLFSSVYSVFEVSLRKSSESVETTEKIPEKTPEKIIEKTTKSKLTSKNVTNSDNIGARGIRGPSGDKGETGATGPSGDKGQQVHLVTKVTKVQPVHLEKKVTKVQLVQLVTKVQLVTGVFLVTRDFLVKKESLVTKVTKVTKVLLVHLVTKVTKVQLVHLVTKVQLD